ncbi:MAG: carbohydrate kinase family protein [Actinomycetota bacterium]|nr:carbohydrate kinase family protein [Actinomycetota bacterium]
MADFDVLVLGDCNPDLILSGGDVEPAFGQVEHLVEKASLVVGGSGAIFACGAARLGLRTAFAGVIGDDVYGRFMLDALQERGVDTRGVLMDAHRPTGVTVILSRNGDRAILTAPGTIGDMRGALVDPDLLHAARHVHVSSFFIQRGLQPDLPEVFEEAHAAGATTSLDPNWDPQEEWDSGLLALLGQTDWFLPNSAEARQITGLDDLEIAAASLAESGTTLAVKLGAGGGLAARGDEIFQVPAYKVDVADTTGAGDSFDAGFVAAMLAGQPLRRALEWAVVCGSLSTRSTGGVDAQPTTDEVERALAEFDLPP